MHKSSLPLLLRAILLCATFTSAAAWSAAANIRADGVSAEERRQPAGKTAPGPGTKPGASAKPADTTPGAIVIKRGDSLDTLVKKHLGHLPFKPDFLKQALVQKNPTAFKPPKNLAPIVGEKLQLPTAADYDRMLHGNPPPPPPAAPVAEDVPDPRRGWVRFP